VYAGEGEMSVPVSSRSVFLPLCLVHEFFNFRFGHMSIRRNLVFKPSFRNNTTGVIVPWET
jgi:hypothetical protein